MNNDTISREAAIAAADRADYPGLAVEDVKAVTDEVVKELKKLPSAERRGRWEGGKCSVCGEHALFWMMSSGYYASPYCPNCGAKMDGEQNE